MRKFLLKVVVLLWSTAALQAQNCETYFPLTLNAEYELTHYDVDAKPMGRTLYKVKEVKTNASGIDAVFYAENYDKKNEKTASGDYTVTCHNNVTRVDMKAFVMNNPSLKGAENMDMTMTGDFLEFPNTLTAGMSLPDATIVIVMSDKNSKAEMGRMTMKYINRKVVGKVSVTTPSGTYEAWKITQEISGANVVMGMTMNMPTMYASEYLVPGKGLVKSETFDKNNKLKAYSLKTK